MLNLLKSKSLGLMLLFLVLPIFIFASGGPSTGISIGNIRLEFILFGLVLLGVALFHHKTFYVALTGFIVILIYKLVFDAHFHLGEHFFGTLPFSEQLLDKHNRQGEWPIVLNLLGLLLGFAMLAKTFEDSGVPDILPKFLPSGWKGPFVLLIFVFILSSFLDNIAAALIGGTVALVVFNKKIHIGYIAAIVAASNAGGAGSVVGDTTTTMMWIDGVSAINVLHAFIASIAALAFFGWFASHQQFKLQGVVKTDNCNIKIDWIRILIVAFILIGAILTNVFFDLPALGVWIAILIGALIRKAPWHELKASLLGAIFLICLVMCASMMPVETLPDASEMTALVLGFVSAVFDNIPLTKLCLEQGHYDWGLLAYAVGFGGSMIWFGSSAGVAISSRIPEARNVGLWIRKGWHVTFAYIIGFAVMYVVWGWDPADNRKHTEPAINCKYPNCKKAIDDKKAAEAAKLIENNENPAE